MAKYRSPYTFPHKSRAAKIDYICGIGGYYSRDGQYPIEFNVSTAGADLSFEHLWQRITKEYAEASAAPMFKEACAREYEDAGDSLYDWALEDCRRNIEDDDGCLTLFDAKYEDSARLTLQGRCGKHLCIAEFGRWAMEGMDSDTLRILLNQAYSASGILVRAGHRRRLPAGWEWYATAADIDALYRYCRQCEIDFTPQKAADALECEAAGILYARALVTAEHLAKEVADKEALKGKAKLLYDALDMSESELNLAWRDLCLAAGLEPTDITY